MNWADFLRYRLRPILGVTAIFFLMSFLYPDANLSQQTSGFSVIIRHAEKGKDADYGLSEIGWNRAFCLAHHLASLLPRIQRVVAWSCRSDRSKLTALPSAQRFCIPITETRQIELQQYKDQNSLYILQHEEIFTLLHNLTGYDFSHYEKEAKERYDITWIVKHNPPVVHRGEQKFDQKKCDSSIFQLVNF